jgi:Protein of unknown function (DUF2946)
MRRANGLAAKLTPHMMVFIFPVEINCSISFQQVTSNTTIATPRQHALWARLLAFVLLAFITYSTTAEAVHKHGNLSLVSANGSATAVSSSGDASSSANESRSIGECVICQRRQHLSVSLLSTLPQLVAPQEQVTRTPATVLPSASRIATPQRGRAPPLSSLI